MRAEYRYPLEFIEGTPASTNSRRRLAITSLSLVNCFSSSLKTEIFSGFSPDFLRIFSGFSPDFLRPVGKLPKFLRVFCGRENFQLAKGSNFKTPYSGALCIKHRRFAHNPCAAREQDRKHGSLSQSATMK